MLQSQKVTCKVKQTKYGMLGKVSTHYLMVRGKFRQEHGVCDLNVGTDSAAQYFLLTTQNFQDTDLLAHGWRQWVQIPQDLVGRGLLASQDTNLLVLGRRHQVEVPHDLVGYSGSSLPLTHAIDGEDVSLQSLVTDQHQESILGPPAHYITHVIMPRWLPVVYLDKLLSILTVYQWNGLGVHMPFIIRSRVSELALSSPLHHYHQFLSFITVSYCF